MDSFFFLNGCTAILNDSITFSSNKTRTAVSTAAERKKTRRKGKEVKKRRGGRDEGRYPQTGRGTERQHLRSYTTSQPKFHSEYRRLKTSLNKTFHHG